MTELMAEKVEKFFASYGLRKYSKGQILIFSGDEARYVYYLVKGRVKEYDISYRGDEAILNIFKPPAFFPMSLAINKSQSQFIYEADTDIEIRQAPADDVVDFIKQYPDVMLDLLSRVYRGVDGLMGRVAYLMSGSAKERLIYELLIEGKRFGSLDNDDSCTLSINEADLGARAGLTRETVSRELKKLKEDGMLKVTSKGIIIMSLARLEAKL